MRSGLDRRFYDRDTLIVARQLLGNSLVKIEPDGTRLRGCIVETEAYIGTEDLACHARSGRTQRNASMWGEPGHAYVYFTYGMHWMLNVVTERSEFPAAVLIRALVPLEGLDRIRARRSGRNEIELCDGPAKLCQVFGIDRQFNGIDLCQPDSLLYIEHSKPIPEFTVTTGPRVGLNNVDEPWKSIPWRFRVDQNSARKLQPED